MGEVNYLADLLSAVTTVISSFVSWISTVTTSLIANPLVQLLFAMLVAMLITRFVIGLVKTAGGKGKKRRK